MFTDTLLLIDGNNLAYRCRYTFQLSNRGQDVSVVYGFLKVLDSLIKKNKPVSVVVAWDGRVPKFRRQLVPEYKNNRHTDEDPLVREDFNRQMEELHNYALPRMGILSVRKHYIEADDLLHHASVLSLHENNIIVTGDKDLFQSISERTKVLSPVKNILYDISKFEETFGISLSRYVWYKALQGDGSDNIPGVHGVGEVTAAKLLNEYPSVVDLFDKIDEGKVSKKVAEAIKEFGLGRVINNYDIMNLSFDRCGARYTLLEELKFYKVANKKSIKDYFLRSAFVSLLDSLPTLLSDLQAPRFNMDIRCPVIIGERKPLESI